jgi:hypothetical protein
MALIGRMFVVLFAFLMACLAAAIVLQVCILMPFWGTRAQPDFGTGVLQLLVGFSFFFIALLALLPAIAVIALAEAFRLRSVVFYAAAGGLLAFALGHGLGFTSVPPDLALAPLVEAFAASGIVAGLAYWLIAGRDAGRWCERVAPPSR